MKIIISGKDLEGDGYRFQGIITVLSCGEGKIATSARKAGSLI
jgi:hypothetical protein